MISPAGTAPTTPTAEAAPLIEARGVSARLGPFPVLTGIDLRARAGELVALVGPNGAGKSTLLHVLAGDIAPTAGDVLLDGRPLASFRRIEAARRRGVLPQQFNVAFPFTVTEVVRMARAPWQSTDEHDRDDEAVDTAIEEAGITHLATREFTSLSGGERARVAFARLLAQRPTLMLLDEPTASLDIHYQEALLQVVRARIAGGCGAVVVMHDLGLAAAYADRVALLSRGTLAADGAPAEVLRPALLSEVYRHELAVIAHPNTATPIVVPARLAGTAGEAHP